MSKTIIIDVVVYLATYFAYFLWVFITPGGSPTDNATSRAYGEIYGWIFFSLLGILLTIVNWLLLKQVTIQWIKYLAFCPFVLPAGHLAWRLAQEYKVYKLFDFEASREKQEHMLVIELRTKKEMSGVHFKFQPSPNEATRVLDHADNFKDGYYIFEIIKRIHYESDRYFTLYSRANKSDSVLWETPRYYFRVGHKPKPSSFTEWKSIKGVKTNKNQNQLVEFRYLVAKKYTSQKPSYFVVPQEQDSSSTE
jgi:hypothetical protein